MANGKETEKTESETAFWEELLRKAQLTKITESLGSMENLLLQLAEELRGKTRELNDLTAKMTLVGGRKLTPQEEDDLEERNLQASEKLKGNLYAGPYLIETLKEVLEEEIPGVPQGVVVDILEGLSQKLVPETPEDIRGRLEEDKELSESDSIRIKASIEDLLLEFARKALGIPLGKLTPEQSRLLGETAREITDSFL